MHAPGSTFDLFGLVGQCSRVSKCLGNHLQGYMLQASICESDSCSFWSCSKVDFLQEAQHMPPLKVGGEAGLKP